MGEIWNRFRAGSRAPLYIPSGEITERQRIILPRTNAECGQAGVCLSPPPRPPLLGFAISRTGVEEEQNQVPESMPRVS